MFASRDARATFDALCRVNLHSRTARYRARGTSLGATKALSLAGARAALTILPATF